MYTNQIIYYTDFIMNSEYNMEITPGEGLLFIKILMAKKWKMENGKNYKK
jgi:hypothetical protein